MNMIKRCATFLWIFQAVVDVKLIPTSENELSDTGCHFRVAHLAKLFRFFLIPYAYNSTTLSQIDGSALCCRIRLQRSVALKECRSVLGPLIFNLFVSGIGRTAKELKASMPSRSDDFTVYASRSTPAAKHFQNLLFFFAFFAFRISLKTFKFC